MDHKKNTENSKLLQECYYLTRLIQEHNNGKKTRERTLPRHGANVHSNCMSKYQKINTNKSNGNNFQLHISSNVSLTDKTSVHKTWINNGLSTSKSDASRNLEDSAPKSDQKHCMYFNPNFLKTSLSELDMTGQNMPVENQKQKSFIHINPKALIHMVYSDLQKEENSKLSSEKLVIVDNDTNSCKKNELSHVVTSDVQRASRRDSLGSRKLTSDVQRATIASSRKLLTVVDSANSKLYEAPHSLTTSVGKQNDRHYSFCSQTKLVRNSPRHRYKDTSNISTQRKNLPTPHKLVNTSPGYNTLHSWKSKAFSARQRVALKATTSSSANAFKMLGKSLRRNSLSHSRKRTSSSSSTSTVVKAAKLVCSKYKITRNSSRKRSLPHSQFSIDNRSDKNIKRLKKVKKYSLKYESAKLKNNSMLSSHKKFYASGAYNQNRFKKLFSSKGERNRKLKINRGTELQRSKNGIHSISHLSLVRIGGVLYRSSKLKLARSVTPKENPVASKTRGQSQGKRRSRCIVHVRGNAFLMDSTGKTLQRISKNKYKPNVEIKNPSPLKRVDIGGVTYIQKSANVLIRTNTHKARSLLSQAKQKSIAMLTNKMRKSNQTCIFYHRFGKCSKLEKGICPHIHDPKQVAVCRRFLQGSCDLKNCMLSHEVGPEKMPTCRYFLEGCCVKDSCPYLHVKVNPKAEICKNFLRGYCPEGQKCRKRHIYICPDFENGKCSNGKYCPYPHKNIVIGKSRIKRKAPMNKKDLSTKEKLPQKRYYQEEEQTDSLKLEETGLEVKAEEDLEEHKTELEIKRIKILQKVDLMKKAWQNSPISEPVENTDNQNAEVFSQESSGESAVERPKLGTLPAFIPIG